MTPRPAPRLAAIPTVAAALALAGCGGVPPSGASEPAGRLPVRVTRATFPAAQRLAEHTRLVIAVRNIGARALPDVAVTITSPPYGTAVQSFATALNGAELASRSRPVWIVDRPPGPCSYSCRASGAGAARTAGSNTWALGPLPPGATARFVWAVTAVRPGTYRVRYALAAAPTGDAVAVLPDGTEPSGTFVVEIDRAPPRSYVAGSGHIVASH